VLRRVSLDKDEKIGDPEFDSDHGHRMVHMLRFDCVLGETTTVNYIGPDGIPHENSARVGTRLVFTIQYSGDRGAFDARLWSDDTTSPLGFIHLDIPLCMVINEVASDTVLKLSDLGKLVGEYLAFEQWSYDPDIAAAYKTAAQEQKTQQRKRKSNGQAPTKKQKTEPGSSSGGASATGTFTAAAAAAASDSFVDMTDDNDVVDDLPLTKLAQRLAAVDAKAAAMRKPSAQKNPLLL
jgi:hypothetical protein